MSLPQTAPQSKPQTYTILPDDFLETPEALELSGNAYSLLTDFWRAWQRATHNGRKRVMSIPWTHSDYRRRIARPTFDRARREIEEAGFIRCVHREWGRWAWSWKPADPTPAPTPKLENTPCKESLQPIRQYSSRDPKAEIREDTLVSREPESRRIAPTRDGPPRSIGDILNLGDYGDLDLTLQIERITGENHWRRWWTATLKEIAAAGCLGEFEGWVRYAADCADPRQRPLKDLGELKAPGPFLVSKALELQRRHGFRWFDYPGISPG